MDTDIEGVTLVVRVIRSFPHRNIRNIVLRDVSLEITTDKLLQLAKETVSTSTSLPPPFRRYDYDCMKVEHQAHGSKTSDPVINTEGEVLELGDVALTSVGIKNETEISLFRRSDYDDYKLGPNKGQTQW